MPKTIGVVGMGYVGLTLTAALAEAGHVVHGVDVQPRVLDALTQGRPHIFEPGVEEVFAAQTGRRILVGTELPRDGLDAAVICVSTPIDEATHKVNLSHLAAAARDIARWCGPETLVVVRSTVPIGASRSTVLPPLLEAWGRARLVMAPERTIQGQALRELVELPQVVGGLDEHSVRWPWTIQKNQSAETKRSSSSFSPARRTCSSAARRFGCSASSAASQRA